MRTSTAGGQTIDRSLQTEDRLRRALIDKILGISAVVAAIALASAELRAVHIGWATRDVVQISVVGFICLLALFRRRLSARHKALFLVGAFLAGGVSGFATLGMLGGTVFVFPVAAVVVALFYPARAAFIFASASMIFCCLVGIGFSTGVLKLALSSELLMTHSMHWVVYLVCLGFFFVVTCTTIVDYRRAVGVLMDEVGEQRDQLAQRNEELTLALNHVKKLSGLLPICASCKKIRDDQGYWNQLEAYIHEHSEAQFSHCICPACLEELYPEEHASWLSGREKTPPTKE